MKKSLGDYWRGDKRDPLRLSPLSLAEQNADRKPRCGNDSLHRRQTDQQQIGFTPKYSPQQTTSALSREVPATIIIHILVHWERL